MFKILNYIFVRVPEGSSNYELGIPYTNYLWYETGFILKRRIYKHITPLGKEMLERKGIYENYKERRAIAVKYVKPDSAIRYHIINKIFNYIIIKIN